MTGHPTSRPPSRPCAAVIWSCSRPRPSTGSPPTRDPHAVARIYAVKGRPADHPLILHIADAADLDSWTTDVPDYARRLATAAWPGPLTLVLRRSPAVGDFVTGGQDTVAVRVPDHDLAREILREFGSAVAAPSANRFGRVSPTTADHVRADLDLAAGDVVVDGGPAAVGVESTIVDCTGPRPILLRPGRYSAADIERLSGVPVAPLPEVAPRVSGSLASHYSPTARVVVVAEPIATPGTGLIALESVPTPPGVVRLMAPSDIEDYARRLYWALREADALALELVAAIPPGGDSGLAHAVADRLARAAADTD
ncbi:MAG: L-threonylcarbamoyladenylate synthase [Candidatus Nanopelagicales bacterium]